MQYLELVMTGKENSALAVLIAAAACIAAFVLYARFRKRIAGRRGYVLLGLRMAVLVLLALLFLSPYLVMRKTASKEEHTFILIDSSGSMGVKDIHTSSRLDAVTRLLDEGTFREKLEKISGPVHEYYFGEYLSEYRPGRKRIPRGTTRIAGALSELAEKHGSERVGSVIIFSDGIETGTGELPPMFRSVPVYTVGVGSAVSADKLTPDLSIHIKGEAYRKLFLNEENTITFTVYEKTGYSGPRRVAFRHRDEVKAETEVVLKDGFGKGEIVYVPAERGAFTFELSVDPLKAETVLMNNSLPLYADVYNKRIRVLYAEGSVKSEYKFLKRFLLSNRHLEPVCLLQTASGRFLHQGTDLEEELSLRDFPGKELLRGFDTVILGDISITAQGFDNLLEFCSEGKGVIFSAPLKLSTAEFDVKKLVPSGKMSVVYAQPDGRTGLSLTEQGHLSKLFSSSALFLEKQAYIKGIIRFRDASAAFRPEIVTRKGNIPFVLSARTGKGNVFMVASDTTYLWYLTGGQEGKDVHAAFWGSLIQSAAGADIIEDSDEEIEYRIEKRFFEPSERIEITAYLPKGMDRNTPDLKLNVLQTEISTAFVKVTGGNREYRAACTIPEGGKYMIRVGYGDKVREIPVYVKPKENELDRLDMDSSYLRLLSQESGGFYVPFHQAEAVFSRIRREIMTEAETIHIPLTNSSAFFILIVSLLGTEWFLRKKYDLY